MFCGTLADPAKLEALLNLDVEPVLVVGKVKRRKSTM
jgi:hypothetical protein